MSALLIFYFFYTLPRPKHHHGAKFSLWRTYVQRLTICTHKWYSIETTPQLHYSLFAPYYLLAGERAKLLPAVCDCWRRKTTVLQFAYGYVSFSTKRTTKRKCHQFTSCCAASASPCYSQQEKVLAIGDKLNPVNSVLSFSAISLLKFY